jgi:uncharacterized membrane protein YphA (DoxX/SURF4 family)
MTAASSDRLPDRPAAGIGSAGPAAALTAARAWGGSWLRAWDNFFFRPSDVRTLAALRIATGLLWTWSCVVWLMDVEGFFGDSGWMRADDAWRMNDQPWQWSWYFAAPGPEWRLAAAILSLIAAVMLTVGLATPLAAWVSLAALVSASNRAPLNVFGFDDIVGLVLIGLVVAPSGAAWSLDARMRPELVSPGEGRGRCSVRATIGLRLIQVQLCVVYFFSGCGKLLGGSWWDGTALWGAAANAQYRTLDLTWLADDPLLVNALTLTTLFWEVAYAALIWPRLTRPLMLVMACFVHLGIGLAMGMMEFGLAMVVANLSFADRLFGRDCSRG